MRHLLLLLCCLLAPVAWSADEGTPAPATETTGEAAAGDQSTEGEAAPAEGEVITAEVDWFEEIAEGGGTAVVLIALMALGITFLVERLWNLRRGHIVPDGLVEDVERLWHLDSHDEILEICEQRPSTLARMVGFLVHHRRADPELLIPGASDIGARELKAHQQKAMSLAVVAGLAPLLGLLGTMIGMIESFKLVEQFGDEGGASMLAGSISKALITTALGLIIAIPALAAYHFVKYRVNRLGVLLDEELERLVNSWLLGGMVEGVTATPPEVANTVATEAHERASGEQRRQTA